MRKELENLSPEEQKKLAEELLANAHSAPKRPKWYNRNTVDEVRYCEELLARQELRCINGRMYSIDGMIDKPHMQAMIAYDLKPYIRKSLNKAVDRVLETLKMLCVSEPIKPTADRIHFQNGTYFLSEGFCPTKEWTMNRLPVDYDTDAPAPKRWLQYMQELLHEEDIPTVQEFLGYCMLATTKAQAMLVILGKGGEGKSRIVAVMQSIFGSNSNVGSVANLEHNQFYAAEQEGKLLFMDDDMKMEALSSSNVIKTMVTCEGTMTLERKGKQVFQGIIYAKLLCLGNGSLKALHDKSQGFYRRQIIIHTKDKPEDRVDDPYLKEKLEAELPGIVLWCVEGLMRLVQNDYRFTVSERSKQLKKELIAEDDNVQAFVESCGYIEFRPGAQSSTKELYEAYNRWCSDNAEKPRAESSFSKYLHEHEKELHIERKSNVPNAFGRNVRGYSGIRAIPAGEAVLVPIDDDDPDFPF